MKPNVKPKIKKFDYTSKLGWSASRYDMFFTCKRQYYYNYYGKYDKDYQRKKIEELKQLTSASLEIGTGVHDAIKILLDRLQKSEKEIDALRFFDYVRRKVEENLRSKKFKEVYYGEAINIDTGEILDEIESALNNFLSSHRYNWITTEAISHRSNWVIDPDGYGESRINGMKIYCKVDFLFPVNDLIYILDWKTGRPDEAKHNKQLLGYTAWTSYHFDKEPNKIIPIISYLKPFYKEVEPADFIESNIRNFATQIKHETELMYSFCGNIEENIPKDKEAFEQTTNEKICSYCNYRELCR